MAAFAIGRFRPKAEAPAALDDRLVLAPKQKFRCGNSTSRRHTDWKCQQLSGAQPIEQLWAMN
jgi:hypothetical protein